MKKYCIYNTLTGIIRILMTISHMPPPEMLQEGEAYLELLTYDFNTDSEFYVLEGHLVPRSLLQNPSKTVLISNGLDEAIWSNIPNQSKLEINAVDRGIINDGQFILTSDTPGVHHVLITAPAPYKPGNWEITVNAP